ncbi:hypothetical protein EZV62_009573 [Acer yangbiense]|uniref:Uncharacterized protein n=1 Tax=Acer yangbiense TaxID=1000413 RepID=A0A5C7I0N7_9ROSI|nr:hypothetical protein EZV62_009573 [Acer yangbiense]
MLWRQVENERKLSLYLRGYQNNCSLTKLYERLDGSVRAEERFAAIRSFSGPSYSMSKIGILRWIASFAKGTSDSSNESCAVYKPSNKKHCGLAERKLQLSHTVVGDDAMDKDQKETMGVEMQILGEAGRKFEVDPNILDRSDLVIDVVGPLNPAQRRRTAWPEGCQPNPAQSSMVVSHCRDKAYQGFNPWGPTTSVMQGSFASKGYDSGLDEASYLAWVEKFKETSQSSGDFVVAMGNRKKLPEDKHFKLEAARKKTEEKKLAKWEAHGYHSLSVKDPMFIFNRLF